MSYRKLILEAKHIGSNLLIAVVALVVAMLAIEFTNRFFSSPSHRYGWGNTLFLLLALSVETGLIIWGMFQMGNVTQKKYEEGVRNGRQAVRRTTTTQASRHPS